MLNDLLFENIVISPGSPEWERLPKEQKKKLMKTFFDKYGVDKAASIQRWHLRMMCAARYFAGWSKCLSRQIGAVVVRDKTILSTGYNGPPRGVAECHTKERRMHLIGTYYNAPCNIDKADLLVKELDKCPRQALGFGSGEGLHLCSAGHAEANSIANAAREGVRVSGADMYCWCPLPCMNCAKMIIGAGIARVFYVKGEDYDKEARWELEQAGVVLVGIPQRMVDEAWNTSSLEMVKTGSSMDQESM